MDIINCEEAALQKLSLRVSDLEQEKPTLLRFLRARDGNLVKAEEMLRKSMKWRDDNRVNSYGSWVPPDALAQDFIFQYLGTSNCGYPIMYIPLGRWNVRDRMENGYLKETFEYRIYFLENVLTKVMERTKKDKIILLVDMAQLTFYKMAHVNTMNFITAACQDFEANYPERLKKAFVINTPWVFPYGFAMVKPWISPKTLAKLEIFDSNKAKWLPVMEQTIPQDILPKQILA